MKKLLVLALGFALMACTNPMATEEVPAVETDAEMTDEAADAVDAAAVEATEEAMEEVVAE